MKYLIFLGVILTSCTSAPLSVNHYLLHNPMPTVVDLPNSAKSPVIFSSIILAEYLRQTSLIKQLNEHELYYSRQDLWAEELQSSYYKALIHDLNTSPQNIYLAKSIKSENELTLNVNLQHFHITNHSSVISSGTYRIEKEGTHWVEKSFYFSLPLISDGYPHAVSQLRKTIVALALQINQDIKNLRSNND